MEPNSIDIKKKDRVKYEPTAREDDFCPECGTRFAITGKCPECGYRAGSDVPGSGTEYRPEKKKRRKPPKDAQVVKPVKGICSKCSSKVLRFYDDGSGRCTSCGREFRWDGGPSRILEEEYFCKRCSERLEYIEEYERWYCYECDEYM